MVTVDYDALWKEAIEDFFQDFIMFFAPDLYPQVDFAKGYEFLEQELRKLFEDAATGKKYTDKLAKIYLKNGAEKWILIHIEIQGSSEQDFAERMFQYFYRVYDRYLQEIFTIALLTDDQKNYRPNQFKYSFLDTKLSYKYRIYKVLKQSEKKLQQSDNPFSMAILAGLYVIKSKKKDVNVKYNYKIKLVRLLYEKKWDKTKINKLLAFIDAILRLPEDQEKIFKQEIFDNQRGDDHMGLSIERSNLARQLRDDGKAEVAAKMISMNLPEEVIAEATGLTIEQIKELKEKEQN